MKPIPKSRPSPAVAVQVARQPVPDLPPTRLPAEDKQLAYRTRLRPSTLAAIEVRAKAMRQPIDMARIYRRALQRLPETTDGQPPLPVPTVCPVTLDELLSEARPHERPSDAVS